MPTYVYECSSCSKEFEVQQRITEDPLTDCNCGASGTVKRLIQPIAVMFKGSGFHINDYAAKPPSEAGATSPAPAAAPAAEAPKAEGCTGQPASCPSCATD